MDDKLNIKDESLLEVPVLPLRDVVVYPYMVIQLFVGRERSIKSLEAATDENKQILLVAQKDSTEEQPEPDELYETGTLANILQLLKLPDGTVKVLVEGTSRAKVGYFNNDGDYLQAGVLSSLRSSLMSLKVTCLCVHF